MIARSHGTRDLPSSDPPEPKADRGPPQPPSPPLPPSAAERDPPPPDKQLYPGHPRSLSGIALRAFLLGATLSLSLALLILALTSTPPTTPLWRIPFFFAALSTFHFLEFWTTARYNTPAADVDAFLLASNWPAYAIAHASATAECLVTGVFFPDRAWAPAALGGPALTRALIGLGLVMVAVGQAVRTVAMVQCGESFNHIVQSRKKDSHFLVTSGVYAVFRHPSYFGFFWWSVGTQLVLGNAVCSVAYAVVVWKFFSARIPREERFLVGFFGVEYVEYRNRVKTWIPFIQ
ncbi:related to farnesyl cysteine carboxyl-methyltransferase [Cephalotrichum gorgonifer]|uniref:Protein-S-isoprenylcysteine O-methyltransferase n=1 Tax=Cephalotrichum gorgonifer TaxID=2041049 RepID=A0AAE8MXU0_9PEZI|nr:related to farnesyl cysteine carboxyl-methyltransferase [Cephalotrichum gorgonifer]